MGPVASAGACGLLSWSNAGPFIGGALVGFLVVFILASCDPLRLVGVSPAQGWVLSTAGRGADKTVHVTRLGVDMGIGCRGQCDDIRLGQGAPPPAGGVAPGVAQ